jgi:predicted dehydrogenase
MALSSVIRWGILGCGAIAGDFVIGLKTLSKLGHKIEAAAARDAKRAEEFAEKHEIGKSYGSYLDLVKDPNIGNSLFITG